MTLEFIWFCYLPSTQLVPHPGPGPHRCLRTEREAGDIALRR